MWHVRDPSFFAPFSAEHSHCFLGRSRYRLIGSCSFGDAHCWPAALQIVLRHMTVRTVAMREAHVLEPSVFVPIGDRMNSVRAKCRRKEAAHADFPSPLPLAAFEEYMLRDDRPKYPMSIIARLQVRRATGPPGDRGSPGDGRRTPPPAAGQGSQNSGGPIGMDRGGRSSPRQFHGSTARDTIACPRCGRSTSFRNRD